jgi:GNAT superfamily N-acetyltransferase
VTGLRTSQVAAAAGVNLQKPAGSWVVVARTEQVESGGGIGGFVEEAMVVDPVGWRGTAECGVGGIGAAGFGLGRSGRTCVGRLPDHAQQVVSRVAGVGQRDGDPLGGQRSGARFPAVPVGAHPVQHDQDGQSGARLAGWINYFQSLYPGSVTAADITESGIAAEHVEQLAWREFYAAAPPAVRQELGIQVIDLGDALALRAPGVAISLYNGVLGVGLRCPPDDGLVDRIRSAYADVDTPYRVQAVPLARPVPDQDWWAARGYRRQFDVAKFVRGTEPVSATPTDLAVVAAGPGDADTVLDIIASAWHEPPACRQWQRAVVGSPGWSHYLALDGDRAVATAALFLAPAGGWLGWAVTRPEHRRRGAQTALVARRVADARSAGCRLVTVETAVDAAEHPAPSYRTMQRCGFHLLYVRTAYFAAPHRPDKD